MYFSTTSLLACAASLISTTWAEETTTTASSTDTAIERAYSTIEPSLTAIEAAAATAVTSHTTSNVTGKVFDRFVVIWLENIDYDKAHDNDDMIYLSQFGIVLNNYWAVTHPSEPNYMAAVGGDYFGLDDDRFLELPSNVSSIVDLLEDKGISWAEYQEHMPYTGFEGFNYSNQETYANDYVRKHNPLVLYNSVAEDSDRLSNIKNFTEFYVDLENEQLPQWMFITPNMTNDGHDTTIDYAAAWSRDFLSPLLNNSYFMENTLVLLTFDENETYSIKNNVYALLLGGVIPEEAKGTEDSTFYEHYSEISTIEDNWDLYHLGRYDVDANVFQVVANQTDWTNIEVDTTDMYNNNSYLGYINDIYKTLPDVNCSYVNKNGMPILPAIYDVWCSTSDSSNSSTSASSTTTASSITSTNGNSTSVVTAEVSNGASGVATISGCIAVVAALLMQLV